MPQIELIVEHEVGLHARPAAQFVQLATSFPCDITVRNVSKDSKAANAKSILGVLSIGVNRGNKITVEADGEQEQEALAALQNLVETNFGEE